MYPIDQQLSGEGLTCERGGRVLFSDVNFVVKSGQALVVQGQNGAGKTSLLRIMVGLSQAEHGVVRWNENDIKQHGDELQRELCYIGHQPAVKNELTVRENLNLIMRLWPQHDAISVADLAAKVGLRKRLSVPCSRLSAGQVRRVSLARLFISTQSLWVLDEPLTALDVDFIREIEAQLQKHMQNKGIVILTTHRGIDLGGQEEIKLTL
jgi:heme exporter protein A